MIKKKWLGALLNFLVPGLGHAYSRNLNKGLIIYILFFVIVFSLRFIAYNFVLFVVCIIAIILYYIYVIVSGYRDVKTNKTYQPTSFDKWYVYLVVIVISGVFVNLLKGSVIDRFTPINFASIPTPAMNPALKVGDVLAYNKTKAINRNDVTIFRFPGNQGELYVKRCIGMPGDSFQIKGSTVFINGKVQKDILPLKFIYTITTNGSYINANTLNKYEIDKEDLYMLPQNVIQAYLTRAQASKLKTEPAIQKIEPLILSKDQFSADIYPGTGKHRWNTDFFGPIYLPKKGSKIQLTEDNIDLYYPCIKYENPTITLEDTILTMDGNPMTEYEFTENYYFMMGDNRHNSFDSRYWGFLPQNLIIGKAMYLYWSTDSKRIGQGIK